MPVTVNEGAEDKTPRTSSYYAIETTPLLTNCTQNYSRDLPCTSTKCRGESTRSLHISSCSDEEATSSAFLARSSIGSALECRCQDHERDGLSRTFVKEPFEAETSYNTKYHGSLVPTDDSDRQNFPSDDSDPSTSTVRTPLAQLSPWFNWHLPQGVSLRLENSGSVARDHLASERTFLAYMRTSLAIASSGVALVQLFSMASASVPPHVFDSTHRLHTYVRPLGGATILIGLLVLIIGVVRYFAVQSALTKGYFPAARLTVGFITVSLTALVTLTFAILLAGKLEPKEKTG